MNFSMTWRGGWGPNLSDYTTLLTRFVQDLLRRVDHACVVAELEHPQHSGEDAVGEEEGEALDRHRLISQLSYDKLLKPGCC
jgi:hypothetical protein